MSTSARLVLACVLLLLLSSARAPAQRAGSVRDAAALLIAGIVRADYEGDRPKLQQLHEDLAPLTATAGDPRTASRLRYWQGFALWRRAFNGFNGSPPPADLGSDLEGAIRDFEAALRDDPGFVDAKVGIISCMQSLAALSRDNPQRIQELVPRFMQLFKESLAAAPGNPRLLWVYGAQQYYNASQLGKGRREDAIATYAKGLDLARTQKGRVADPLEPTWGEPELLMSLAWTSLNAPEPDARAAKEHAQQALALVPHWRYLRDILMPQIDAKLK